tara:strand:- start:4455 stop:5108 length:654 start_codon:yes stop_codon:yes gene_type:complete
VVGATGIEPVTPAVSRQCSTAELRTLNKYKINILKYLKIYKNCFVLKNVFKIRSIKREDIDQVLKIYNFYINNGFGNFEEEALSLKHFLILYEDILKMNLPFLVAEQNQKIIGFTYLNWFRKKSGYRFAFENSIYVDNNFSGKGIGSELLQTLLTESEKNSKIKTIIAVISSYNSNASIQIHKKNGFSMIGTLKKVGIKKEKWLDAIYMQKILNEKN